MKNNDIIINSEFQTPETQAIITSQMAITLLKKGNERFLNNNQIERNYNLQIAGTASGQYPFAVILSCIDSRVSSEIIFDQGIGDLFNVCVAGNIVNEDVLGSIEYACKFAGVKLVLVLGHTSCGAVKGACDSLKGGNLTYLLEKIKPAVEATQTSPEEERSSNNLEFVNRVALKNINIAVENIHSKSPVLHDLFEQGEIEIAKAIYDVSTGEVKFLDEFPT